MDMVLYLLHLRLELISPLFGIDPVMTVYHTLHEGLQGDLTSVKSLKAPKQNQPPRTSYKGRYLGCNFSCFLEMSKIYIWILNRPCTSRMWNAKMLVHVAMLQECTRNNYWHAIDRQLSHKAGTWPNIQILHCSIYMHRATRCSYNSMYE